MSNFLAKMIQQDGTMVVVIGGESYTVSRDNRCYDRLKEAFKTDDATRFLSILSEPVPTVEQAAQQLNVDNIEVRDGVVYMDGERMANPVCEAIQRFAFEGLDYKPLVRFLQNLMQNPSKRAVDEGYKFLEACGLTITEDGCFLAYKSVKDNYLDKYSGKYDNRPGAVNSMSRNLVDDNCNITCSHGFHVGALAYAGPGGWYNNSCDKVVICKVNPKNIVSVPTDHSFQKLRVCEYTVVADYKGKLTKPLYSGDVNEDDYDDDNDDNYYDYVVENPDDMLVGYTYSFYYKGERRYVILEENNNDHIICELVDPEACCGEIRRFNKEYIEDIEEEE